MQVLDKKAKEQCLHGLKKEVGFARVRSSEEGTAVNAVGMGAKAEMDRAKAQWRWCYSQRNCSSCSRRFLHLMHKVVTGLALSRSMLISSPQSSQSP